MSFYTTVAYSANGRRIQNTVAFVCIMSSVLRTLYGAVVVVCRLSSFLCRNPATAFGFVINFFVNKHAMQLDCVGRH